VDGYLVGLNVTHPGKQVVLKHLDGVDATAGALGAVNTIVFRAGQAVGYNTDTTGFAHAVETGLQGVSLDRVVLTGRTPDTDRMLRHFDELEASCPTP
jgi:shikimate dehydrogenase